MKKKRGKRAKKRGKKKLNSSSKTSVDKVKTLANPENAGTLAEEDKGKESLAEEDKGKETHAEKTGEIETRDEHRGDVSEIVEFIKSPSDEEEIAKHSEISTIKTELERELSVYSEIQKKLDKQKATIVRLRNDIRESKQEHNELKIQFKKDISGRDLEIKVLKRSTKKFAKEIEQLKRKQVLLREKFQMGIIGEIKQFLTKKLDMIDIIEPSEEAIKTITQPLETKIDELKKIVLIKDMEANKLKTEFSGIKRMDDKTKSVHDKILKENKTLKKEIQKLFKANELLREEIDKIHEELSK